MNAGVLGVDSENNHHLLKEAPMRKPITWQRIRWHIYRTPLSHVIKYLRRLRLQEDIKRRRALLAELPRSPNLTKHATELRELGYTMVTDIVDPVRMEALSAAGEAKLVKARSKLSDIRQNTGHKDFWVRLLDEDMQNGMLSTDSPFVKIALQPEIVSVVAAAMGEVPRLDYVLLTLSHGNREQLSYSQLWHRDYDDTNVIKLFFYLTDVISPGDGPFTFIPGPDSDKLGFQFNSHLSDEQISRWIQLSAAKAVFAPKLSAFMVNTSRCLHMGSRTSPGHQRLLFTATYFLSPRLYPEPSPPRFTFSCDEDPIVRTLLTAD